MFKVVPDYEFIMINTEGVIKSCYSGNVLKPSPDKDGYLRVRACNPEEGKIRTYLYIGQGVLRFIKQRKTFKHISKNYNWD